MLKKILALFLMLYAAVAMAAVDVNKANDAQLDAVKGIGPATSKAILAERKKGDFKDWSDFIARVKGIGDKKAETLSKEGLTVNGEPFKAAAAAKKDAKAEAKAEKKEAKATAKEEKKEAKAEAKADKKAAEAKKDAKMANAEAKKDAKEAKADAKKDAASASKPAASAKK
jgi:competence protein ComEA